VPHWQKRGSKFVKMEVYKVLDIRCMPIRSQAGQATAQAGKGGARDHATGSPVPPAVLSQYNTSDNNTDNEGANDNGTNNEVADDKGLGDGHTKEEAVNWVQAPISMVWHTPYPWKGAHMTMASTRRWPNSTASTTTSQGSCQQGVWQKGRWCPYQWSGTRRTLGQGGGFPGQRHCREGRGQ
jgi:hypothetical protein